MNKQNSLITRYCLAVVVMLALLGPLAQNGRGNFILWNDESLTVNSSHSQGILYDTSRVFIVLGGTVSELYAWNSSDVNISGGVVGSLYAYNSSAVNISGRTVSYLYAYNSSVVDVSGGSVGGLWAYDSSTVNISGGSVSNLYAWNSSDVNISGGVVGSLYAYNSSAVNISGGTVSYLNALDSSAVNISGGTVTNNLSASNSSTVDVSGGSVGGLWAYDSSTVNISGGSVISISARDSSTVIFHGRDFRAAGSLVLDGERVLGTGILSCEWFDGTRWSVNIAYNETTATILAITEPAHILTIDVDPNDVGIDTVTPDVGSHSCGGGVSIKAERFVNCPDVYTFDHWDGDVNDANSANTTVFMDSDKTITAVFVDGRQCGDECHPYPQGDVNKDCKVNFLDVAIVANTWLECTDPNFD